MPFRVTQLAAAPRSTISRRLRPGIARATSEPVLLIFDTIYCIDIMSRPTSLTWQPTSQPIYPLSYSSTVHATQRLTGVPSTRPLSPPILFQLPCQWGKTRSYMPLPASCHLYAWRTGEQCASPYHPSPIYLPPRQPCASLLICTWSIPTDPYPAKHFAPRPCKVSL